MLFLLISIFGLLISDRFVYRLENFHIIFPKIRKVLFVFLNIPSVYFLFFKEHLILYFIYIGLILASLIFLNIYFELLLKNVFFRGQIKILDSINLHIKSGQSPLKSAKLVFQTLTQVEKIVFEPLNYIEVDVDKTQAVPIYARKKFASHFFEEMYFILRSTTRVSDQIDQFKRGLRIQNNLRHKSRLSALQVRAQAVVAAFIYVFLLCFAIAELQLANYPAVIIISVLLMAAGLTIILKKGNSIKWTI
jgi:hypothetical protein